MADVPQIILLGKNSAIGRHLESYFLRASIDVVALSSKMCDLLDRTAVKRFFRRLPNSRPYAIVFLAVINKPADNSYESFLNNMQMVKNLVDVCTEVWIESMVYFSSVDVYGNAPQTPITEFTPLNPDTWYGLAKANCEWMVRRLARWPTAILRIPGVYGPLDDGDWVDPSVIGRFVREIQTTGMATVEGVGDVKRDYLFVNDLCRIVDRLICQRYDGTVNVATGESRSLIDILTCIGNALGRPVTIRHTVPKRERAFDLVFDVTRLRTVLPGLEFTDMATAVKLYC